MQALQVDVRANGADLVLSGRLDGRTAPIARAVLHSALDQGSGDLLVRVGDLEIWDAVGMGVLVGAHARARRAGRRLVLADVPPRQLRLLRATRVGRVLTVQPLAVA
jgi:anti-anti-sigma factor